MAALHGREDALLDPARFPRLLRQANDAEIADVRKVGEDDYEISDRRGVTPAPLAPAASTPAAGPVAAPGEGAGTAEPLVEVSSGTRENGQRFGVRFRRGSRGGLRPGDIPLIGVVQMDPPPVEAVPVEALPAEAVAVEAPESAEETERKPARPRRAPRKKPAPSRSEGKATAAKAEKPAKAAPTDEDPGAAPAAPVKRGRSRARKKAE
jgi:hypothetical protein